MKKISLPIAAAAMAVLFSITPAAAGKDNDTLVFATKTDLENLDAYYNNARVGIILARHIWDNLLYRDPEDFSYKPALATSYEWIDDLTLEFKLREGVTFHNGASFSADDVVYTLNFVSSPDSKVVSRRNVDWIKNVEKIDDYTVRINLSKPFPAALDFVAGPLPIYPHAYYAEVGPEGMNRNPVGTGPYKVVAMEQAKSVKLEKNEDYYKDSPKGQPKIGKLEMRTIPDDNTAVAELMTGGVDWIWRVNADQAEMLGQTPNLDVVGGETMRVGFMSMDAAGRSGVKAVQDLKVRQAIAMAVNRQGIVDNLMPKGGRVIHAACYPKQFGCTDDVTKYTYDPEKAKALLAEAGYPDGFEVTIDAYRDRDLAEAIIGDLRAVGIKADLSYNKYSAARDRVRNGQVTLNFSTWGSYSINDVSAITSNFFRQGPEDLARDADVAALLEKGDTSVDPEKRKAFYADALKKISSNAYWLPMFTYSYLYAFNKDLDFQPSADEIPRFFMASWK
ncbi:MAG: ABC transporter substrate-binding protein [Sneathiella sp.]|jgi:peptide/nickel transport system substrate-binding protein|uniref:ABC transporter substrate-binding protein n=1 Tax=Sneathiella sp. TaxID=1964365 RepID=UPI000C35A478|nr:ABC transporter substrate-binding protein [Sneathiella sp.]MAL80712.1 ABC transporter substrate-binding protein [Sneathiella sp.]|tara:strand:- start:1003 stop:2520 length:1518 start_codon:yes stop_codon:yes gene_type:complete